MRAAVAAAIVAPALPLCGCSASARGPSSQPSVTRRGTHPGLVPAGIAFWDTRHGVLIANSTGRRCGSRPCRGVIETTSDGGARWTLRRRVQSPVAAVTVAPGGEVFVTAGTCAETCDATGLLVGSDSGRAWRRLPGVRVSRPSFATRTKGWALASETAGVGTGIATTSDAGRAWRTLPDPCPHLEPIADAIAAAGARAASLLCVSSNPATDMEPKALLRTEDGGRSWTPIDRTGLPGGTGSPRSHGFPLIGYLPGMDIRPDGHGWLWADRGFLYRTEDAEHWRIAGGILQPDRNHLVAADPVTRRIGYALLWDGHSRLIRTSDGGRSWTTVRSWRR